MSLFSDFDSHLVPYICDTIDGSIQTSFIWVGVSACVCVYAYMCMVIGWLWVCIYMCVYRSQDICVGSLILPS